MRASTAAPLPSGPFGEPRCGTPRKKHEKLTPKPKKNRLPGGSGGSGGGLGGDLGPSWLQVAFGSRFGHFWAALEGPRWSQDGPKRRQDEPSCGQIGGMLRPRGVKMAQEGAKMAIWRSFGELSWAFCEFLGAIFAEKPQV